MDREDERDTGKNGKLFVATLLIGHYVNFVYVAEYVS